MDEVILVDFDDRPVGTAAKLAAHVSGELHRAFSVIVYDSTGRMLLQQRARSKYHSGGLWSNTCCSHPRPGEATEAAAHRRLVEEMGFDCHLERVHTFIYRAEFDNGLIEHEYDHVFIGRCDTEPRHDPNEVEAWRWIDPSTLEHEAANRPDRFTPWFLRCLVEIPARRCPADGMSATEPVYLLT